MDGPSRIKEDDEKEDGGHPQLTSLLEQKKGLASSVLALPKPTVAGHPNLKRQASLANSLRPLDSVASLRKMSQLVRLVE